jgi:hypothetical protein
MATYNVVEATPIYYLVDVSFQGMTFRQLLASSLINGNLATMLQAYADQYEQEWVAANGVLEPA